MSREDKLNEALSAAEKLIAMSHVLVEQRDTLAARVAELEREREAVRNNAPACGACAEALFTGEQHSAHSPECVHAQLAKARRLLQKIFDACAEVKLARDTTGSLVDLVDAHGDVRAFLSAQASEEVCHDHATVGPCAPCTNGGLDTPASPSSPVCACGESTVGATRRDAVTGATFIHGEKPCYWQFPSSPAAEVLSEWTVKHFGNLVHAICDSHEALRRELADERESASKLYDATKATADALRASNKALREALGKALLYVERNSSIRGLADSIRALLANGEG